MANPRPDLRHAGVRGRILILGEDDATGRLDLRQVPRAIGASARKDHPDDLALARLGQRAEEEIHRQVQALGQATRGQ